MNPYEKILKTRADLNTCLRSLRTIYSTAQDAYNRHGNPVCQEIAGVASAALTAAQGDAEVPA